ncbi:hypothetical protein PVAP13_6NG007331 [Panicum virgatum]|uniref:Uncharacterized protein n=1 Tax=Panicum virgatum TaxID=38727 RepID=A0A8T0QT65_PANVG|nr:hypothetical protein PVAP13_6NG007331 [Panicum virgatum]
MSSLVLIAVGDGVPDAVSCGRKRDEEQAAEHADAERQDVEHLLRLLGRRRVEAPDDVLVPGGDDPEDGDRERGVHEVDEGEPVPGGVPRRRRAGRVVDEPEAPGRGDAVVDAAVGAPEGVGEGGEDAGEGEDGEEPPREERGGGVAGAVVGEGRGQQVEGQERARGEQVGKVRRRGQRPGQDRPLRGRWFLLGEEVLLLLFMEEELRLLSLSGCLPLPDRRGGGRSGHGRSRVA